ncbi:MAG: RnfABCDGE type electron transport complex subunit D [Acholeplasmataceae bacterium]|nr:RnfABCDGE type electron transport complex subunit D [Acholeplasmataceae bacterium]
MLIFASFLVVLLIAAIVIFGFGVLLIAGVALATGVAIEFLFAKIRKKEMDVISWLISPLILTLFMPATAPWWLILIATFFGVFFGKAVFGGHGKNVFNPAVVGVLFATISFPAQMNTSWINPQTGVISATTPLTILNRGLAFDYSIMDLLLGNVAGALGETFRLGIIILGLILVVLKIADWRIPTFYIGSVFLMTWMGGLIAPESFRDPVLTLFVGGVLFTAFFVATDPVTLPIQPSGRIIFAVGLAFFTVLIRNFSAFPEGVIFAIILMNAIAPLIDQWVEPKKMKETEVIA